MSTPDILADRFPSTTCDTPTSTRHVIIARAELRDRRHAHGFCAQKRLICAEPATQAG
jgi:hypothetical protein